MDHRNFTKIRDSLGKKDSVAHYIEKYTKEYVYCSENVFAAPRKMIGDKIEVVFFDKRNGDDGPNSKILMFGSGFYCGGPWR